MTAIWFAAQPTLGYTGTRFQRKRSASGKSAGCRLFEINCKNAMDSTDLTDLIPGLSQSATIPEIRAFFCRNLPCEPIRIRFHEVSYLINF